jgi:parallel beta-helix repeat protein
MNEGVGICYYGDAKGTVSQNICRSNQVSGIYVAEQASPVLDANT